MVRFLLFVGWLAGSILISAQTETINSPIVIKENNTIHDGNYRKIKLQDNSNSPMIIVGDSDYTEPTFRVSNITIKNFILDGNGKNQPNEIYTDHINTHSNFMRNNIINIRGSTNVLIENCIIVNARSGGICIEKSSDNITIRNCVITDSVFDGIAGYYSTNCTIEDNTIANNNAAGLSFDLSFIKTTVRNNVLLNNDVGVFVRNCIDHTYTNNRNFNKSWDFYFNRTDDDMETYPSDIKFINNQFFKNYIIFK